MTDGKKQQFNAPVGSVDNQGTQYNVAGINEGVQISHPDPDLQATVQEISDMLQRLDASAATTTQERMNAAMGVIQQIESKPTLRQRAISAAKAGALAAIQQNPIGAIVVGVIEGWTKEG